MSDLEKAIVGHELARQERTGLVKKTIKVHRGGKVFDQVRYVRPDIAPAGKPKGGKEPVKLSVSARMFKLLLSEQELGAVKMLLPTRAGRREGSDALLDSILSRICQRRALRRTPTAYAGIKEAAESIE